MNKKKSLALSLLLSLFLLAFTACGEAKTLDLEPAGLADKLAGSVKFVDQMTALDDKAATRLFDTGDLAVKSQKVYVSTGATAEEIGVWACQDEAAARAVTEKIQARVKNQTEAFSDYVPGELTKLKAPFLKTYGTLVVYVCCDNVSEAQAVINAL